MRVAFAILFLLVILLCIIIWALLNGSGFDDDNN
jgi:hypothetical protein